MVTQCRAHCSRMIADAHIMLNEYEGDHDLVVMPHLDGFDLILGRSFLQASKAVIHHETANITWPTLVTPRYTLHAQTVPPGAIHNPWDVLDVERGEDDGLGSDDVSQPSVSAHHTAPLKVNMIVTPANVVIDSGRLQDQLMPPTILPWPLSSTTKRTSSFHHHPISLIVFVQLLVGSKLVLGYMTHA